LTDEPASIPPLPAARIMSNGAQLRLIGLAAVALVALLLVIAGVRALLAPAPAPPEKLPAGAFRPTREQLAQLTIAPVRSGADSTLIRANGAIAVDGDRSTPVLLPFSGQVIAVYVEPGQRVAPGQPLLRIASPEMVDARNTLAAAGAQQASATEALRVAEANAARQKAIYETAGGALKDYRQAQADLVAAQSAARTAQSAVNAAQNHLAIFGHGGGNASQPATIYRAPVGGLIADRNVAPGQFVTAGSTAPLMTITDPTRVWLVAQLAESDVASVHVGDQVEVTTPALPGRTFAARVDNVGAALDPASHRLAVRATISNPDGALKPQMFASFTIRRQTGGADGIFVPASAVIHEGDTARVWIVGRDKLLYARAVTTAPGEGGQIRIVTGLTPGDRVVTAGALFVNEAGIDQ